MAEAKLLGPSKRQATVGDPNGLSSDEVHRRLAEFGPNTVSEEVQPRWRAYLAKFWSPIPWLLEAAILIEIGRQRYVGAAVIAGLLLFNATLGFVQEGRVQRWHPSQPLHLQQSTRR